MRSENTLSDWRSNAIQFLTKQTCACDDTINHFVNNYWQQDVSDEENLEFFETYQAEYQQAFSY